MGYGALIELNNDVTALELGAPAAAELKVTFWLLFITGGCIGSMQYIH